MGASWAQYYESIPLDFDAKFGNMKFLEAMPVFVELEAILEKAGKDMVVIQVGSSSGREIAYFANKFRSLKFIGIDIAQEILDYSANSHPLHNLDFALCSAKDVGNLLVKYKDRPVAIFSSGALQYVQPEHLDVFFSSLASHQNLRILVNEPASEAHGRPDEIKGSVALTRTHNYVYYAKNWGMRIVEHRIIKPYYPSEDFPGHIDTVHYYCHATSIRDASRL